NSALIPFPPGMRVQLAGSTAPAESLAALLLERGVTSARRDTGGPTVLLLDGDALPASGSNQSHCVVVALREPYVLARYPAAGGRIACYSSRLCALEALADLLVGRVEASGRLPVTVTG